MRTLPIVVALVLAPSVVAGGEPAAGTRGGVVFRYWVFESDRAVMDRFIPPEKRAAIKDSNHVLAKLAAKQKAALLKCALPQPGLLVEKETLISSWPRVADTWAASRAADGLLGGSTGAGFLGVREKDGTRDIRIEYTVLHTINTTNALESKLFYEGPGGYGGLRVFLAPIQRDDGTRLYHVVAFQIGDPDPKAGKAKHSGHGLPPDLPDLKP